MKYIVLTMVLATLPFLSHAEFTKKDLLTEGDSLVKVDSRTDQEWLDPYYTFNMSTQDVLQSLSSDVNLTGFRLATKEEADYMFSYFHTPFVNEMNRINEIYHPDLDQDYANKTFDRFDVSVTNETSSSYDYNYEVLTALNGLYDGYFSVFNAYDPSYPTFYDVNTSTPKRITRASFGIVIDFNEPGSRNGEYVTYGYGHTETNNTVQNGVSTFNEDGIYDFYSQYGYANGYYDSVTDNLSGLRNVDSGLFLVKGDFNISDVSNPAIPFSALAMSAIMLFRRRQI